MGPVSDIQITHLELLDKAGQQIQPRDFIVYGHALGRCAGLRWGVVVAIYQPTSFGNEDKIFARVRGVDDDWGQRYGFKLLSKDSTLQFRDRILKVKESQVHPDALKILKEHLKKLEGTV